MLSHRTRTAQKPEFQDLCLILNPALQEPIMQPIFFILISITEWLMFFAFHLENLDEKCRNSISDLISAMDAMFKYFSLI